MRHPPPGRTPRRVTILTSSRAGWVKYARRPSAGFAVARLAMPARGAEPPGAPAICGAPPRSKTSGLHRLAWRPGTLGPRFVVPHPDQRLLAFTGLPGAPVSPASRFCDLWGGWDLFGRDWLGWSRQDGKTTRGRHDVHLSRSPGGPGAPLMPLDARSLPPQPRHGHLAGARGGGGGGEDGQDFVAVFVAGGGVAGCQDLGGVEALAGPALNGHRRAAAVAVHLA
jgi:hypothetical protein